jgi:cell division protein ZapD
VADNIIFEQPLNERIRTFLRLEFLFSRVENALLANTELHNRNAIDSLLNILSVFERSDLKAEIIKELERLISNLSALENTPGVDTSTLEQLLANLDEALDALHLTKSSIGQTLRDNEFLYSIRQRSSIAGGTCDFDLPAYHHWLQHSSDDSRRVQILEWSAAFSSVRAAIEISMELIRGSTRFNTLQAPSGFYQHSLDSNQPTQLIRVKLPKDVAYFPEISGGKHRFTVRFMHFDITQRPQQVSDNVDFQLSCCVM